MIIELVLPGPLAAPGLELARERRTTSLMHFLQGFGVDSFSVKFPVGRDPDMAQVEPSSITRFDRATLGHITPSEHRAIHGSDLNCPNCPICRGHNIESQYLSGSQNDILTTALNAHEAIASYNEFLAGRNFITSNEFDHYKQSRHYLSLMPRIDHQSDLSGL